MDSNDFISTEEVVAEAAEFLNDTDFTHGVGKSFYELIVHRAVEKLALHTFFSKVTKDIYDWNSCGTGIIAIPKNCFNVRDITLFNSSCDKDRKNCGEEACGCCKCKSCWTYQVNAHYKRNFNKFGSTRIKTSHINPGDNDPVYGRGYGYETISANLYVVGCLVYFGMQNGQICFSDSATKIKNMRIEANGFGSDTCDLPIIPRALREVCVHTTCVEACKKIMIVFNEYKSMYQVYKDNLDGNGSLSNPGSWLRAERYVKSLNTKQRFDLGQYYGNPTFK